MDSLKFCPREHLSSVDGKGEMAMSSTFRAFFVDGTCSHPRRRGSYVYGYRRGAGKHYDSATLYTLAPPVLHLKCRYRPSKCAFDDG